MEKIRKELSREMLNIIPRVEKLISQNSKEKNLKKIEELSVKIQNQDHIASLELSILSFYMDRNIKGLIDEYNNIS